MRTAVAGPPTGGRPCYVCASTPTRPYLPGPLCATHEPRHPYVDPTRTAAALMARRTRLIVAVARAGRAA